MNTILKRTLVHTVLASFAIAAVPGHAADSRDATVADSDTGAKTLVELCESSPHGMVPKERVVKAIHRMLDMGETPEAVKMSKDSRRKVQFDVFWKEVQRESLGG